MGNLHSREQRDASRDGSEHSEPLTPPEGYSFNTDSARSTA